MAEVRCLFKSEDPREKKPKKATYRVVDIFECIERRFTMLTGNHLKLDKGEKQGKY